MQKTDANKAHKGVDAVERALRLLQCFDGTNRDLALHDLARKTGYYKSTILRLAASLERFGYLARMQDGRFRLGPAAMQLGAVYHDTFDLAEIMRPELKRLSDITCETASFYIRDGARRICLYRKTPMRGILHSVVEGKTMPLERGASGRVLLAWGDDAYDPDNLRAAGYALSRGERDPEVAALAVPIICRAGKLQGALSLSGLINRFTETRIPDLLAALRDSQTHLNMQITQ